MVRYRRVPRPVGPTRCPKAPRRPARPRHPCAGGRTAGSVPEGAGQRGCGPPRTRFGGFPRVPLLRPPPEPELLCLLVDRFHPVPDPRAVFGVDASWTRKTGRSTKSGLIPRNVDDFHSTWVGGPQFCPQRRPKYPYQEPRAVPARSAPRAARKPMPPVAPRIAADRVVECTAAAAPDAPTRSSLTSMVAR